MRPGAWVLIISDNVVGEITHVRREGWLTIDCDGVIMECDHFEVVLLD